MVDIAAPEPATLSLTETAPAVVETPAVAATPAPAAQPKISPDEYAKRPEVVARLESDRRGGRDAPIKPAAAAAAAAAAPVVEKPAEPVDEPEAPKPEIEAAKPVKKDETPAWMKAEITKARNAERAAEAKADKAAADLTKALDALTKVTAKPVEEPTPDPRPTRDKFDNPDAYDTALETWSKRQGEAAGKAQAEAAQIEAKKTEDAARVEAETKAASDAFVADWERRKAETIKEIPDLMEVIEAVGGDIKVSEPMSFAIMNATDGPKLMYLLAKNPEDAARIAALTIPDGKGNQVPNPIAQVFELGKFAAKMAEQAKPRVSRTPEPIGSIGVRNPGAGKPRGDMRAAEYALQSDVQERLLNDRRGGINAH